MDKCVLEIKKAKVLYEMLNIKFLKQKVKSLKHSMCLIDNGCEYMFDIVTDL